jgi:hypothetical protein
MCQIRRLAFGHIAGGLRGNWTPFERGPAADDAWIMGVKWETEWRSLRTVGIVYDKVHEIGKTDLVYDEVHEIVDGEPSLLPR